MTRFDGWERRKVSGKSKPKEGISGIEVEKVAYGPDISFERIFSISCGEVVIGFTLCTVFRYTCYFTFFRQGKEMLVVLLALVAAVMLVTGLSHNTARGAIWSGIEDLFFATDMALTQQVRHPIYRKHSETGMHF